MNMSDMRELPMTELASELQKFREKTWKMRFQARGEPLESPGALRKLKKQVARMLTVLREKELAGKVSSGRSGGASGVSQAADTGSGES